MNSGLLPDITSLGIPYPENIRFVGSTTVDECLSGILLISKKSEA